MDRIPAHPFEHPVIMRNLLRYLSSVDDLKRVRLISKAWHNETFPRMKRSSKLVLRRYSKENATDEGDRTDQFLIFLRNSLDRGDPMGLIAVGYRDVKFIDDSSLCSPDYLHESQHLHNLFWRVMSPKIRCLEVVKSCRLAEKNFVSGIKRILERYEHLEELKIKSPDSVRGRTNRSSSGNPVACQVANLTTSSLRSVSLSKFHEDNFSGDSATDLSMFKAFFNMMPRLSNLTLDSTTQFLIRALTFPLERPRTFIQLNTLNVKFDKFFREGRNCPFLILEEYVENVKPPLQNIKIKFQLNDARKFRGLNQFLSACKNTVTYLELKVDTRWSIQTSDDAHFTELVGLQLPFLKNLIISVTGIWYPWINSKNLKFNFKSLEKMPVLEEFRCTSGLGRNEVNEIWNNGINLKEQLGINFRRVTLNELRFLRVFEYTLPQKFSLSDLQLLSGWMRNIKQMKIFYDEEEIQQTKFFELWETIESATLA